MTWLLIFFWLAGAVQIWLVVRCADDRSPQWRWGGAMVLAAVWPLYAIALLAAVLAVACLALGPLRDWRLP